MENWLDRVIAKAIPSDYGADGVNIEFPFTDDHEHQTPNANLLRPVVARHAPSAPHSSPVHKPTAGLSFEVPMSELPYMQFYTSDWYSSTKTLTPKYKGYFIDLLCLIWEKGKLGRIKLNASELASLWMIPSDYTDENTPQEWYDQIAVILTRLENSCVIKFWKINNEKGDFIYYEIYQERIAKDQKRLRDNAKRQRKHYHKHREKPNAKPNANLTLQKSEVRSQIKDLTTYPRNSSNLSFAPNGAERESEIPKAKKPNPAKLVDLWNTMAHVNLPRAVGMTDRRRIKILARLQDHQDQEYWVNVIRMINESPFLRGEQSHWKCSFDWILNEANLIKIVEGNYAPTKA